MSTKIHYGHRWVGKGGMPGLLEELVKMRKEYEKWAVDYMVKTLKPEVRADWIDLLRLVEWAKNDSRRGNPVDLSCSLVVIPIKYGGKEEILINPFGHAVEMLEKRKDFEYFGYWNNTDPDEDISAKEWKRREKMWGVALPPYGAWNECGFIWEMDADSTLSGIVMEVVKRTYEQFPDKKPDKLFAKQRGQSWGLLKPVECMNDVCTHRFECGLSRRGNRFPKPGEKVWWPDLSAEKGLTKRKENVLRVKCLSIVKEKKKVKKCTSK